MKKKMSELQAKVHAMREGFQKRRPLVDEVVIVEEVPARKRAHRGARSRPVGARSGGLELTFRFEPDGAGRLRCVGTGLRQLRRVAALRPK